MGNGGAPTGVVTFYDGQTILGTVTLASGGIERAGDPNPIDADGRQSLPSAPFMAATEFTRVARPRC